MEIYVEIFLLQNTLINFCLLKLIYLTTKSKTNFIRLFFASFLCALPNLIVIQIINNTLFLNLIKLTTAIMMISLAYKQNLKQFIFNFILLFLYTYAFLGIVLTISSSTHLMASGAVISNNFKLETICFIFLICTYILEYVVKHIKLKINTNNLIYNITLTHKNRTIKTTAYLDTGNFLNQNGKPILVLNLNTYLNLTHTNLISFYATKSDTIQSSTINSNGQLKLFKIDKLIINNTNFNEEIIEPLVAVSANNCFKNTNYDALLSPLFL